MAGNAGEVKRAFFFLAKRTGKGSGYAHLAVLFAEGLAHLGWHIDSNLEAWRTGPEEPHLFPGGPIEATEAADLIVFEEDFFILQGSDRLPELSAAVPAPKIYLDRSDLGKATGWTYRRSLRKLDHIFRCHSSAYFNYPENISPVVFGISDRIALACEGGAVAREDGVMWNFRHTQYPHSARLWAQRKVKPILEARFPLQLAKNTSEEADTPYATLMRAQTDGRHFTSYYSDLKKTLLCSCFGGWFLLPVRQQEAGQLCMRSRTFLRRLPISTAAIAQWDSWRLWEAFAAGAAVLHFDFERHRFLTGGPAPEPMKHYLPVDAGRPAQSLAAFLDDRELILSVGQAGKQWAREHYSSEAISKRMLATLGMT